jgi:class 3 adenylate cyclase
MESCTGYHVSRTARIEPITAEGQIYVSEIFAALASTKDCIGFACDYVGEVQLAKKYGAYRVYLLNNH